MIEIKNLHFEHGAMSIIQMGEELIEHPSTAVNELVKNALIQLHKLIFMSTFLRNSINEPYLYFE